MTGEGFRDLVLLIVGNIFIAVLAVKAFSAWAQDNYGQMWALLAGAIVITGLVWFPDQVIAILKRLWGMFSGGATAAPTLTPTDTLTLARAAVVGTL